jgi:hypothetical protein
MHDHLIRYGGGFVDDVIVAAEGLWLTTADGRHEIDLAAEILDSALPGVTEALAPKVRT